MSNITAQMELVRRADDSREDAGDAGRVLLRGWLYRWRRLGLYGVLHYSVGAKGSGRFGIRIALGARGGEHCARIVSFAGDGDGAGWVRQLGLGCGNGFGAVCSRRWYGGLKGTSRLMMVLPQGGVANSRLCWRLCLRWRGRCGWIRR